MKGLCYTALFFSYIATEPLCSGSIGGEILASELEHEEYRGDEEEHHEGGHRSHLIVSRQQLLPGGNHLWKNRRHEERGITDKLRNEQHST